MAYTPTTQTVMLAATYSRAPELGAPMPISIDEFNRWPLEVLRKAKESSFEEGVVASGLDLDYTMQILDNNPYREKDTDG